MSSPPINPVAGIIKTPPRSSKKYMRSPSRSPLQSPLQTGNPNPFIKNQNPFIKNQNPLAIQNVFGFSLLPFNRYNDKDVIIGNRIDGLGMTKEEVERLKRSIENDGPAKKKQKKSKKMQVILPEITPISSNKTRRGKRPVGRPKSDAKPRGRPPATKKSGGKRTRKQFKKHKKSRKSKNKN